MKSMNNGITLSENVKGLMQLLSEEGKTVDEQMLLMLLNQMSEMHKEYQDTLRELNQELQNTREKLTQLEDNIQVDPQQKQILEQLVNVENKMKSGQEQLRSINNTLEIKAAEVIDNFKKTGISALNNTCQFLGLKEHLIALRDTSRSNASMMENSIDKIEKIEDEVKNALLHAKNAVRTIRGKELLDPSEERQLKIFDKLKAPYQKRLDKYNHRTEKLNMAIKKLENLEQRSERTSILGKLEENKEKIASTQGEKKESEQTKDQVCEPAR